MTKFRTQYNYDFYDFSNYETPEGLSLTVPDQSLSVREIFDRYRRGAPLDIVQREALYPDGDDPDFSDYNNVDDPNYDLVDAYEATLAIHETRSARLKAESDAKQAKYENELRAKLRSELESERAAASDTP